jgi:hypothetical protein
LISDNDNDAELFPAIIDHREKVTKAAELPRFVPDVIAKQQRDQKLAAALKKFDMSVLDDKPIKEPAMPPLVAANDNNASFEETESFPLIELLNRKTFHPDPAKRAELQRTAWHIRRLYDLAGQDALGLSVHRPGKEPIPDYDLQRHGPEQKIWFEVGQSLDCERRVYGDKPSKVRRDGSVRAAVKGQKNGEPNAVRYDGPVRTASRSQPISNGFDPFAQSKIDARRELDEIEAAVGPLWPYLKPSICDNAPATDIGGMTGAKGTQASGIGTAIIKIGLTAAAKAIAAMKNDQRYREDIMELNNTAPIPAGRKTRSKKPRNGDFEAKRSARDC